MFLIQHEFKIQVEGLKNIMASTDRYIFSLNKCGSYYNVELMEFPTSSFGKRMTLSKAGIKDIIIFLTQKIK